MFDGRCLRTRLSFLGVFYICSSRFCYLVLLPEEYCLWIAGLLASLLALVYLSDFMFLRFVCGCSYVLFVICCVLVVWFLVFFACCVCVFWIPVSWLLGLLDLSCSSCSFACIIVCMSVCLFHSLVSCLLACMHACLVCRSPFFVSRAFIYWCTHIRFAVSCFPREWVFVFSIVVCFLLACNLCLSVWLLVSVLGNFM